MTNKEQAQSESRDRVAGKKVPVNIEMLAQDYSAEALAKLAELTGSKNDCIAFAAARAVLERSHGRVPARHRYKVERTKGAEPALKVRITRFNTGKEHDRRIRHHELPMVYGGWQGPRNLRDGDGQGLPAVPGQRPGVRDQQGVRDGKATGVQGSGAQARARGGTATAGADGDPKKTKTGPTGRRRTRRREKE
jgi:hypothetical protein